MSNKTFIALVLTVFFISGMAALIFENLWFHTAGFIVGNSISGVTVVLAGFMGGLALGNALVTRYGRQLTQPLKIYLLLELVIGCSGFLLVLLLPELSRFLAPLFRILTDYPVLLQSSRLLIVFILLLIPATAMGATLPILVNHLSRREHGFGGLLGKLYGCNTLGAMCGALLPEVFLIQITGIKNTALVALSLNLFAVLLVYRLMSVSEFNAGASKANMMLQPPALNKNLVRLLLSAALAGALLLALEVIWFRFLLLNIAGTSLIFAVMLATVLFGIGLGGLVAAALFRKGFDPSHYLREIALLSGISVLSGYYGFYYFNDLLGTTVEHDLTAFVLQAVYLMLPVSVISGVLFTGIGKSLHQSIHDGTTSTGLLTFFNTLGAMSGAVFGGLILLPHAGVEHSMLLLACGYFMLMVVFPAPKRIVTRRIAIVCGLIPLFLLVSSYNHIERFHFQKLAEAWRADRIVEISEGQIATNIYLAYKKFNEPYYYRLMTNSYSMAGNSVESERYMKLFVYLPALLHPSIQHALLISFGVGSSAQALSTLPGIESIDMVDISRDVFAMSRHIYDNAAINPLNNPAVKTHIEDGRFYLLTTDKKYDLITGEPPPPGLHKVVNLYSKEYFQLIYDRLNSGGIATYWLPTYQFHSDSSKSIIRAFCEVFENCSLWTGYALEWILMGSKQTVMGGQELRFSGDWPENSVTSNLTRLGIEIPEQLGALFLADHDYLDKLTRDYPPVTDNFPKRIFKPADKDVDRHFFYQMLAPDLTRQRFAESRFIDAIWSESLRQKTLPFFEYERLMQKKDTTTITQSYFMDDLHQVLTRTDLVYLPLFLLGSNYKLQAIVEQKATIKDEHPDVIYYRALGAIASRQFKQAGGLLSEYLQAKQATRHGQALALYLYVLCLQGELEQANILIASVLQRSDDNPVILRLVAWLHEQFGTRGPE